MLDADNLIDSMRSLSEYVYTWALSKGFWDDKNRNAGEMIALMHSELSEALEALRHGNPPSEHVPSISSLEEELADLIIRVADFAGAKGLDLGTAILKKMAFNETRPYKHGKKF